jgi:hypothetical protein
LLRGLRHQIHRRHRSRSLMPALIPPHAAPNRIA